MVESNPTWLVQRCMALAGETAAAGNPPFAALLVGPDGTIVAQAVNRQATAGDPTAHAEIELLRASARLGHRPPLRDYLVAVNAEPCSMCASALVKAELGSLAYGAPREPHVDPNLGVAEVFGRARRPPTVTAGVLASEAAAQIASLRAAASPTD